MFDAVIFDWDGTLADTKHFVVCSFQKVLREIKCEVSDEFIGRLMGVGPRNTLREALRAADIPFDEKMIEKLEKKKIKIQMKMIENVNLFDGAIDLLDSLQSRVKMALATMSNRRVIDRILSEKGAGKYFYVIITFDEVQKPKPDPEVFLKCAVKLKCQPEECVVVEDSIFGVRAAKKANMKCIAIPSGAYSIEDLKKEEPDLIVNSLNEKEEIVNFILGENKANSHLCVDD